MTVSGARGLWAAPSDGSPAGGGAGPGALQGAGARRRRWRRQWRRLWEGGGGEPWLRRPWLLGTLDWRQWRLLVRRGAGPAF